MIPISDPDLIRHSRPYVNVTLIAINALVFIFELSLSDLDRTLFFFRFGLIPTELTGGPEFKTIFTGIGFADIETPIPTWGTMFTSMFIHAGWMHFLGNMLFLWVFGDNVEDRLGHVKYLVFYLAMGLAAILTQVAINSQSEVPNIGASGAIAGVLGAYLLLYPFSQIRTIIIFFLITFVRLPAVALLGFWFFLQAFNGLGALGQGAQTGGVAFWAHIGGFVAGFLVIAAFKKVVWREPVWPGHAGSFRRRPQWRAPRPKLPSTTPPRQTQSFAEWLKDHLKRRDLTVADLSAIIGVDSPVVRGWLMGSEKPTERQCVVLAYAMGLPAEEVLQVAGYV